MVKLDTDNDDNNSNALLFDKHNDKKTLVLNKIFCTFGLDMTDGNRRFEGSDIFLCTFSHDQSILHCGTIVVKIFSRILVCYSL